MMRDPRIDHPHGIIGIGAISNFAFLSTGFDDLFPGIDVRVCTLDSNFRIPLWRGTFAFFSLLPTSI